MSSPTPTPSLSSSAPSIVTPSSASTTSMTVTAPSPPPPPREVAAGVSNLGNTCYMNAALQALAHAPELCHALDTESHVRKCPVAVRNERRKKRLVRKRRIAAEEDEKKNKGKKGKKGEKSPSPPPGRKRGKGKRGRGVGGGGDGDTDDDDDEEFCALCEVERLLGRIHFRPEEVVEDADGTMGGYIEGADAEGADSSKDVASAPLQDGPVVPETFVTGFMSKVAPWFKRGVQEDSHEFLRLLIDAMQNSCKSARKEDRIKNDNDATTSKGDATVPKKKKKRKKKKKKEESEDDADVNDGNHGGGEGDGNPPPVDEDTEYPFRLFRGTVESNVQCSWCHATSRKIDPIEDVGLDILPLVIPAGGVGGGGRRGASAARATSPVPVALADVQQALERFISEERLDSGYRCEKCGKPGKAIKTSRLASIPPILTLHLKRFRYGSITAVEMAGAGGGTGRSSRSARGGGGGGGSSGTYGDEGGGGGIPDLVGSSGSAKIEGHVRFRHILDIRPYLTSKLQDTVFRRGLCRLFAVVVHTGKNSHSGHYVAYVCNVSKNEWWKMDDAKVVRTSWSEVERAEAYMLFYRVMEHPVGKQLKVDAETKTKAAAMEVKRAADEARARVEAETAVVAAVKEAAKRKADEEAAVVAAAAAAVKAEEEATRSAVAATAAAAVEGGGGGRTDATPPSGGGRSSIKTEPTSLSDVGTAIAAAVTPETPIGKRKRPELATGEEWARSCTSLPPDSFSIFQRIQEFIEENVVFEPDFFRYITEEYNRISSGLREGSGGGDGSGSSGNLPKMESLLASGPRGVYPPEDVKDGAADFHEGILDLFHQISIMYKSSSANANHRKDGIGGSGGGGGGFLLSPPTVATTTTTVAPAKGVAGSTAVSAAAVVVVKEGQPVVVVAALPLADDDELIIPEQPVESYDGAL